jgi:hypothetical protein
MRFYLSCNTTAVFENVSTFALLAPAVLEYLPAARLTPNRTSAISLARRRDLALAIFRVYLPESGVI